MKGLAALEDLCENLDDANSDKVVEGLLKFCLVKAVSDPEDTSVSQVANAIEAGASYRKAGGGEDAFAKLMAWLQDEGDEGEGEEED